MSAAIFGMMGLPVTEQLPTWLAVAMILVSGITALYYCYIKPGYEKDKEQWFSNR